MKWILLLMPLMVACQTPECGEWEAHMYKLGQAQVLELREHVPQSKWGIDGAYILFWDEEFTTELSCNYNAATKATQCMPYTDINKINQQSYPITPDAEAEQLRVRCVASNAE